MTTGEYAEGSGSENEYVDPTTHLIEKVTATMAGEGDHAASTDPTNGEPESADAESASAEANWWQGKPFLSVEAATDETGARVLSRLTLSSVKEDIAAGRRLVVDHALKALEKHKFEAIHELRYWHLLDYIFIPDPEEDDETMRQELFRLFREARRCIETSRKLKSSTAPIVIEGEKAALVYADIMEGIGLLAEQMAAESEGAHTKDEILDALLAGIEYAE